MDSRFPCGRSHGGFDDYRKTLAPLPSHLTRDHGSETGARLKKKALRIVAAVGSTGRGCGLMEGYRESLSMQDSPVTLAAFGMEAALLQMGNHLVGQQL